MKFYLKQFILGMIIASIPVTIYVLNSIPHGEVLGVESVNDFKVTEITPVPISPYVTPTQTIEKKVDIQSVKTVQSVSRNYSKGEATILIDKYASAYGVDANMMKEIAYCESGFKAEATNGPYGGIYQFTTSTWISNRKAMGLDTDPGLRYHLEEAIRTAAFKMGRDGFGAWPACYRKALST